MSTYSYFPSKDALEYFKSNNKQFSLSDEEFVKFVEIFYVFFYKVNIQREEITCLPETQEKRKTICGGCTHYNKDRDTCNLCGCVISDKVIVPVEICPIQKWGMDLDLLKLSIDDTIKFINVYLTDHPDILSIEEHEKSFQSTEGETNE
jgi:hypothetical protein